MASGWPAVVPSLTLREGLPTRSAIWQINDQSIYSETGTQVFVGPLSHFLQLDPVRRVTGIPGWRWILGIKCSDTMGVGLVY